MGDASRGLGLVPALLAVSSYPSDLHSGRSREDDGVPDPDFEEVGMISQWFDLGRLPSEGQRELGRKLAIMHSAQRDGERYGFERPTHCGVTQLDNSWEDSWEVFFRDRRLGDLVSRLDNHEISMVWEQMKRK